MQDVHVKLNPALPWQKQRKKKETLFTSRFELNLTTKLGKWYILSFVFSGAEIGTFREIV
jgi:hypothetical protein